MNKIKALIALVALGFSTASAQVEIMTVHKADGSTVEYKVAEVERVSFSVYTPAVLKNQYELNRAVTDITAAEEVEGNNGTNSYKLFAGSEEAAITICLPASLVGKSVDLAEAVEGLSISYEGTENAALTSGTLKVSKDKFGRNLTVALEGVLGTDELRIAYTGAFTKSYEASNTMAVTPAGGEVCEAAINAMFTATDATGGAIDFAFGNVEATNAEDLLKADYAIWFTLSAAKLYTGTIDLAQNTNSYTLRLIDYEKAEVIESTAKTTGTITTQISNGKVLIKVDAVLEDGTKLSGEYFGEATQVADMKVIIPAEKKTNGFKVVDPNGDVTSKADFVQLQTREVNGITEFYFMKQETDTPDDQFLTPKATIQTDLINTGTLEVGSLGPNTWSVNYQAMQFASADNEWMPVYDKGTMTVSKEGDIYSIEIEICDSYTMWGSVYGSQNVLKIYYVGPAVPYNGKK